MNSSAMNTQVLLASRPIGQPTADNFEFSRVPIPVPGAGQVLIRTQWLSIDPYMRGRMSDAPSYAPPVEIGQVMVGATVGEVIASNAPEIAQGDTVLAYTGWQQYGLAAGAHVRVLHDSPLPHSTALGVLGMPGFTAYAGLTQIGRPQPGETVVVAAATGPVGSAVGQIAQILGARAVGIAGGPAKVDYLRELGFAAALDHRADEFEDQLALATPDGIDVYFENVGGRVWNAVLPRLNDFARVPVCGLAANYNATRLPEGPDRSSMLMGAILRRSLTVRGFLQREFVAAHEAEYLEKAASWIAEGRLKYREDIVDGLENAPAALIGMLDGANFGKLVVRVS